MPEKTLRVAAPGATLEDLPPTPDFDSYPVPAAIIAAAREDDGRILRLDWSDGRVSRYHAIWLRDNASDTDHLNLETREQRGDVTALPKDTRVATASIDQVGALEIGWAAAESVSRFHPGWLYAHDYSNPHHSSPLATDDAAIEPRPWDAETLAEPPTFDGAAFFEDDDLLEAWLTAICRHGIGRLRDLPVEAGTVARVAERIGPLRETNFGRIFDVRVQTGPGSNAYTTAALTPHTDLPTREYQPGLQFLHCLRNSGTGGRAIMADGYRLAAALREADPRAFDLLTTVEWPSSNRAPDSDYRWQSPVIRLDEQGHVLELRVAPFLRAPLAVAFDEVEEVYHVLRLFFEMTAEPSLQMRFDYRPGDLVAFDNRRILHGREAYEEITGERWLQGCYGEREELLSRLRILARRRRAAALDDAEPNSRA